MHFILRPLFVFPFCFILITPILISNHHFFRQFSLVFSLFGRMRTRCLIIFLLVNFAFGTTEVDILLILKKGIQENDSFRKNVGLSWDSKSVGSDGCPKNWYGVSCINGHVVSIMLNDLGIAGTFDFGAISGLPMLRNLSISNNLFAGEIPKEVGFVVSLEYLDVSRNLFTGSLPLQIGDLKNLVYLNVSSNRFEGSILLDFRLLGRLKFLDLHSNGFAVEVMSIFLQLGSVEYVDLSNNVFYGSLDLGLANTSFISAIRYLDISHNNMTGELFSHDGMPYFDNLEVFEASHNQFVGKVPSFNFVVSLRILRLRGNQLSGPVPEALLKDGSMILSELDISINQLEGPVGIITSATLKNLNLSYNKLLGPLPYRVGHCAIIDLSHNMISGNLSIIQGWGNYVEVIDLSSNLLSGTLPNESSQFLRLTSFKISNNSIEGVLPPVLSTYPELRMIDFSLNRFNDTLPHSLLYSTRLIYLNLSFNNFFGAIPIEALRITSFPETTENLSLTSLDLSHNALTGLLPLEFRFFHNMTYLDLSANQFEGVIPDNLPDAIEVFNVSYNNLSGVVPENLRKFPDSAFHPGNYLLIFPNSATPPGFPNADVRHGSVKKSHIRAFLIAGLVIGASCVVLLAFLMYYRTHRLECEKNPSEEYAKKHDNEKGTPSLASTSAHDKDFPPSLTSLNFPEFPTSSAVQGQTRDFESPESIKRNEEMSPPVSLTSSAISSSSKNHHIEMPGLLGPSSPDKVTGDLHLFHSSMVFSADELSCASAEVIGRSCHGTLYKTVLHSGQVLAVKWLKDGIAKGSKEFAREAKKLGSIEHPNLISLQGYFLGPMEFEKLIISNYIEAPCLALYLHETDPRHLPFLTLGQRLRIALDVARCLNYLHNEKAIPHGNLKSSNILLQGSNLHTLVSDYSLHRLLTSGGTAEQVHNAGALGYRPPEFCSTSKPCPSLKSDVYAYGVILLELLTGRSCAEMIPGSPGGDLDLTEWVRLLYSENQSALCFDPRMFENNTIPKGVYDMLHVALRCILPADDRPDIKSTFEDLSLIDLQ